MHRPALLPAPGFALKIVLGEMADAALTGQRALPAVPLAHGYHFRYPEIDIALRGIFGDGLEARIRDKGFGMRDQGLGIRSIRSQNLRRARSEVRAEDLHRAPAQPRV